MILMTRPRAYNAEFRAALDNVKSELVSCPVLEIRAAGPSVINTEDRDALIFTSRAAVQHAARRVTNRTVKSYAVGPGTARDLIAAGFRPVIDAGGTAKHLLDMFAYAPFQNALYLSGRDVTVNLADHFPNRITRTVVYEAVASRAIPNDIQDALKNGRQWIAPFFSRRSYETFEELILKSGLEDVCMTGQVIAISNKVTRDATLPWKIRTVAPSPNARGMIDAVKAAA